MIPYEKLKKKKWRSILKTSLIIAMISAFTNILVNLWAAQGKEDEISTLLYLYVGFISFLLGFFNPFFIMIMEIFFLNSKKIRSLPFICILIIRIISYMVIGSISYMVIGGIFFPQQLLSPGSILFSILSILFFSLTIGTINFFQQFLGPKFFKYYLISKYHQAQIKEAIFLFIDLKGSTTLAEKTTPKAFFQYLNDFIFLCEEVINFHEGSIYKYVGDCIIVVWEENRENLSNSFHCMKELINHMVKNRPYFQKTYKAPLSFTIGIHSGPTIIGEIGLEKKELGYLSDTINTTQRIQDTNKDLHTNYLLSEEYLESLQKYNLISKEDALKKYSSIALKGKDKAIHLYSYGEELEDEKAVL